MNMDYSLDFHQLYEDMVGCKECNNTGHIDGNKCGCFLKYAHKVVCLYAGFNNSAIDDSFKLAKEQHIAPFEIMIKNRLGIILIGNMQQIQIGICASVWTHLEMFTRYHSPIKKYSIKYVRTIDELIKPCDVVCFQMRRTNDLFQKNFFERALAVGKATVIMMVLPDESLTEESACEYSNETMRQLNVSDDIFKGKLVLDIKAKSW